MFQVTKTQKAKAEQMVMKLVCGSKIEITNDFDHKLAEMLVKSGVAKVSKKKNYGRIAEIEGA